MCLHSYKKSMAAGIQSRNYSQQGLRHMQTLIQEVDGSSHMSEVDAYGLVTLTWRPAGGRSLHAARLLSALSDSFDSGSYREAVALVRQGVLSRESQHRQVSGPLRQQQQRQQLQAAGHQWQQQQQEQAEGRQQQECKQNLQQVQAESQQQRQRQRQQQEQAEGEQKQLQQEHAVVDEQRQQQQQPIQQQQAQTQKQKLQQQQQQPSAVQPQQQQQRSNDDATESEVSIVSEEAKLPSDIVEPSERKSLSVCRLPPFQRAKGFVRLAGCGTGLWTWSTAGTTTSGLF